MFINNMYYLFSVSFMTLWSKLILPQVTFNLFSALPKRIIYNLAAMHFTLGIKLLKNNCLTLWSPLHSLEVCLVISHCAYYPGIGHPG